MGERVAIVGTGQTPYVSRREDANFTEMVYEAAQKALDDAGLSLKDIDAVVFGSAPEYLAGLNYPEFWASDAAGGYLKPYMRIHTGGTVGISTAVGGYYHVASGLYDVVMAVCVDKLSDGIVQYGISAAADPFFGRPFVCGAVGIAALQARRYMEKYGLTETQMAKIASKNRRNALKNPYAQLKKDITYEDALNSPHIADPLRLLDICPTSDGAAAIIYANEKRVKDITDNPAWIKAVASCAEGVSYTRRDFAEPIGLQEASRRAYAMAGIKNPRQEIDVAEIYEAFSSQEPIWCYGLGFGEPEEVCQMIDEGVFEMDGDLPVNPSGGVLSANTIGCSAMARVVEAALQVRGQAGEHQIPNVKTALAHGWGGALQFHVVMILGKE